MTRLSAVLLCAMPVLWPETRTRRATWRLVPILVLSGLVLSTPDHVTAAGRPASAESRLAPQAYRERAGTIALERARASLLQGRTAEGIEYLQQLLDGPVDSFVPAETGLVSAQGTATSLLSSLSDGALRLYQTAHTPLAAAMLQDAIAGQDLDRLGEIVRRYPATDPGFRAMDRLAMIAFDRGDAGTAARLWTDLLADPRHASRVTPALVARTLVALRRTGRDGQVAEVAVRYAGTPLTVADEPGTLGSLLQRIEPQRRATATTGRASTAAAGLLPPAFPPVWHRDAGMVGDIGDLWTSSRKSEARPLATAAGAVFAADMLITREPGGLAVYDSQTGESRGRLPLTGSTPADSERDSRDLHDLTRFEDSYAGNSVLAGLSSDGERVFVIDRIVRPQAEIRTVSHTPVPVYEQSSDGDESNRLLAFRVEAGGRDALQAAWAVGGIEESEGTGLLGGHYFFGPPMVVDGVLLSVTEQQQRLNLVALDPATGGLLWQQPLGYVRRGVAADPVRAGSASPPAVQDGIAVCQTNAGFVVAVDLVTRRLLWAYDYAATETATSGSTGWSPDRTSSHGDLSFPSIVVLRDGNAVFMPHDSDRIHCLELHSGRLAWTAPREDGYFVACLTETSALVVGQSFCRSLSLVDGSEQWATRLGAPAGTGLATDSLYLAPLESGLIAGIDLASGRRVGFDTPRDSVSFSPALAGPQRAQSPGHWQPGNLFTHDGAIFSIGPFGIIRLATAEDFLAARRQRLAAIEAARIELAAGELDSARSKLEPLARTDAAEPQRDEARRLLRELHYLRLDWQERAASAEILAELDWLSDSPASRGRFLLTAVDRNLAAENAAVVRRRTDEFSRLALNDPLPAPNDSTHLVTAASWVPAVLDRLGRNTVERVAFEPLGGIGDEELRRRLLFSTNDERTAEICLELADRAMRDGEFHRAETLLLRAMRHEDVADAASLALARLRQMCGFVDGRVEHDDPPVSQVRISETLWAPASAALCRAFGQSRRDFLTRWQEPLHIVDRGDSRRARLAIVDLDGGVCVGDVTIDARLRFPSLSRQPLGGHFVPVATTDRLYGLSMLEAHRGEPAWQVELPGQGGLLPQLGPYDASFCSVQTRRELTVIDPATGDVIWQRTELPPDRGLHGDHAAGLFGDHEALVLLDADGSSYTVFKTQTGEKLARGRLPIDHRRPRRAYGRRLFFIDTTGGETVARLWDPVTNHYDLDVACDGSLLQASTRDDQLVLLFADGRLLVVDPARAETVVDVRLRIEQIGRPHAMKAFSDADRYYISLYQANPERFEGQPAAQYVHDTPLTMTHVQGRLLAIDRKTLDVAWSRPIEQRSVLDPVEHPLPFLAAVARISDPRFGNRKTLAVEAIDKRTGVILGRNDALLPDQLLQVRHLPAASRVELAGMTTTIALDYSEEANRGLVETAVADHSR